MTDKTVAQEKLELAVLAERMQALTTPSFIDLLEKMAAFSEGKAPAPSVEDFLAWQHSIELRLQLRTSDFGGLPKD